MNFEKYRKKKNSVRAMLDDETYKSFLEFLKSNNLTQQVFLNKKLKKFKKNNYNIIR